MELSIVIEKNQDGTDDTGESGETYDQEIEAIRRYRTSVYNTNMKQT